MKTLDEISEIFDKHGLCIGRMMSGSKRSPGNDKCVWNANIITKSMGKIWFGDLNLTKEGDKLKDISKEIGETLYVLREMDCRFGSENDPIELLISKAVWNSEN